MTAIPMRYKILTVDDSKTVRIIVRKAFRGFDCDVLEASNGAEGLAVATKEAPHLILLDVTMPVMDGVEMLGKLKAAPALKSIPVIMLTAEGGRDNVLKIAKIGVRDYLVKPFKEEVLVEKARRVIDLVPTSGGQTKSKTILDPANILLVEDNAAIAAKFCDGLKHTPWKIQIATNEAEATSACAKTPPDLMILSLSLADDSAFTLFRLARANPQTKQTPIFALVAKGDSLQQQQAQTVGFSTLITKPLDLVDIENKMAKAMNLDTSPRYFSSEGGAMLLRLPENCTPAVVAEAQTYLKPKLVEATAASQTQLVLDFRALKTLLPVVVKLVQQAIVTASDLSLSVSLVASPTLIAAAKNIAETRDWAFYESVESAKLGRVAASQLAPA
jgi:two-component system cell cycle response regulator